MNTEIWSSLFYNISVRHERHECDVNKTRATKLWRECHTIATRTTRVQHVCYTNGTGAARAKNFDFDNNTSFHTLILGIWQMKDHKKRKNFIVRTTFLEMPRSHAKMRLKSASRKLNFVMAKAISKSITYIGTANALARSRIVTHSDTTSFSIKVTLCETSKNYWKLLAKWMLDFETTFKI